MPPVATTVKPVLDQLAAPRARISGLSLSLTETNSVPPSGSTVPCAELRLDEGGGEIAVDSHDFAGGLHLRREHRIGPGEAANGNTASLTAM